jgi:hypothetical protein
VMSEHVGLHAGIRHGQSGKDNKSQRDAGK